MFNRLLATHCAPVLEGIKPANLFSVRKNVQNEVERGFREKAFLFPDITCENVLERSDYSLYLVYREELLTETLKKEDNNLFLKSFGYSGSLSDKIGKLKDRLLYSDTGDFPHEIGLFLGYPADDVEDFARYRGKCAKAQGYWKVYHHVDEALETFRRYDVCRAKWIKKLCVNYEKGGFLL